MTSAGRDGRSYEVDLGGTEALGRAIGRAARAGEFVALSGPLGAGKTTLTKAIALGLEVPESEPVVSPTFVLVREYAGRLSLAHCDAYRLGSPDELAGLGLEEQRRAGWVVIVEWVDRFPAEIPDDACRIEMTHLDENRRRIAIRWPRLSDAGWPGFPGPSPIG